MERDLIVVGAGPGGLMAAKEAAKRGLDVLLLEKQYEIGTPIRTSGGSFIKDMDMLDIPERFYNKIRRVIFVTPNRVVDFLYKEYGFCILDIRAAYQYLAAEAAKKGCEIALGTEAKSPIIEGGFVKGVTARSVNKEIKLAAKVTIDASGVTAVLSRKLGNFPDNPPRSGSGVEYEAYVENLDSDTVMFFVGGAASTGYGWVFPISKERARIGVGVTKPDSSLTPLKVLDNMIKNRHKIMRGLGRIVPIELHAGVIPIEPVPKQYSFNGMMVLGDAAVQANPIIGEGIRLAMHAGVFAADAAGNGIRMGDFSKSAFAKYDKEMKRIASYNKIGLMLQRKTAALSDSGWDLVADNILVKLKRLPLEDMVNLLKCEFSKKNLVSIAVKNPRLIADLTIGNIGKPH